LLLAFFGTALAQQAEGDSLKQANNPLATFRSINFHNYYTPEISGSDDTSNALWMRYSQPLDMFGGSWLIRASLPLLRSTLASGDTASGLGDSNVFATYLFDTGNPSISFGVGPILGLPTATGDIPSNDQWSAGVASIFFDSRSHVFQWGGILTYQHGFGSSASGNDTNILALQPILMLQLGGGYYLRSVGIWQFDLESNNYNVPIGMGIGRVIKTQKTVLNFFVEPQFTVMSRGAGQPEVQLFFGFNTQFVF
jgi:hypothetical protein